MRCEELALAAVADVRWSDEVPDDGSGEGAIGTLTLLITPTGVPGHELVIDHISGSHLLNSSEGPEAWAPNLHIAGDDPPTQIELPVKPSRCDGHAFLEGGGATAFRVAFVLDGKPGEILLRMSPEGMGNALGFAKASCGLGNSVAPRGLRFVECRQCTDCLSTTPGSPTTVHPDGSCGGSPGSSGRPCWAGWPSASSG